MLFDLSSSGNKGLEHWPTMPQPQQNWAIHVGNHLIMDGFLLEIHAQGGNTRCKPNELGLNYCNTNFK